MEVQRIPKRSRRAGRTPLGSASSLSTAEEQAAAIRVILVGDDLEPLAKQLRTIELRIEVIGPLATVAKAVAKLNQSRSHVVLVGLTQPNAMSLLKTVEERRAQAKVLLIGDKRAAEDVETAIASGAAGLLVPPFTIAELGAALKAVMQGEFVLSHSAFEAMTHERTLARPEFIRQKKLNEREVLTLDFLATFLQNKEIADRLGLSVPLTKKILRNVFRKLGVHSRAEALELWRSAQ